MVDELDEGAYRVWAGTGLVAHMPMGDAQRAVVAREAERERLRVENAAKLEKELQDEAELEKDFFRRMRGQERITPADVLARHADPVKADGTAQTRRDGTPITRDPQDSKSYQGVRLDDPDRPLYTTLLREAKKKREDAQAAAEVEPVSQAEFGRVVSKLKTTIENTFGKRLLK
jgi:hypothetical protein